MIKQMSSEAATKCGVNVKGEVKDIKAITGRNGKSFLFTQNNETPILYRYRN